jgi:hypothetical protein
MNETTSIMSKVMSIHEKNEVKEPLRKYIWNIICDRLPERHLILDVLMDIYCEIAIYRLEEGNDKEILDECNKAQNHIESCMRSTSERIAREKKKIRKFKAKSDE